MCVWCPPWKLFERKQHQQHFSNEVIFNPHSGAQEFSTHEFNQRDFDLVIVNPVILRVNQLRSPAAANKMFGPEPRQLQLQTQDK
jgi:hypothetical protein